LGEFNKKIRLDSRTKLWNKTQFAYLT